MKIRFINMYSNDGRTVQIVGLLNGKKIEVYLSVLQLAKIYDVDTKIVGEAEKKFGCKELEDSAYEIRDIIKNFPDVEINNNKKIILDYYINNSTSNENSLYVKKRVVKVRGEDLCGWSNESVSFELPLDIYKKKLEQKSFDLFLKQDCIEFAFH